MVCVRCVLERGMYLCVVLDLRWNVLGGEVLASLKL